jgi:hypothetical protein
VACTTTIAIPQSVLARPTKMWILIFSINISSRFPPSLGRFVVLRRLRPMDYFFWCGGPPPIIPPLGFSCVRSE